MMVGYLLLLLMVIFLGLVREWKYNFDISVYCVNNGLNEKVVIIIDDLYSVCNILLKWIYGFVGIGIFKFDILNMVNGDCVGFVLFCY